MKYLKLFEGISGLIQKVEEQLHKMEFWKMSTNQGSGGSIDDFLSTGFPKSDDFKIYEIDVRNNDKIKNLLYCVNTWYTKDNGETIVEDWDYLEEVVKRAIDFDSMVKEARQYVLAELLKEIEKDTSLYSRYKEFLDDVNGLNIPDWVKRGDDVGLLNQKINKAE